MLTHQALPTISNISNENQSNVSTQQDYTYRMIKEVKNLKAKAFSKPRKPKVIYLTNFHTNTLRDSIHHNERYQRILHTEPNKKYVLKSMPQNEGSKNNIPNNTMTISSNENEISYYRTIRTDFNTVDTSKSGNYYFSLYSLARNETLKEFIDKSRKLRLQKLFNFIRQETFYKYESERINQKDLIDLNIYNYSTSFDLLKEFAVYSDSYYNYLSNKVDTETAKNNALKEKRIQLINDIQKLNKRLHKMQALCENNVQNKFFLLCVKNNTNQVDQFCLKDKMEYEKDQEKIKNLLHINVVENKDKNGSDSQDRLTKKRISQISDTDLILGFAIRRATIYKIFNSAEEFKSNLNKISTKVANLLNKYNEKQEELRSLRNKLEEKKEEEKTKSKELLFWEEEIAEKEKQLRSVKLKNEELTQFHQNLPKGTVISYKVLFAKIISIYKKLNEEYPMISSKMAYNKKKTPLICLKELELTLNHLLTERKMFKEKNPQKYYESKKEIDKRNKMKQTQMLLMKEKERMRNKIIQIIEKNKKIALLPKHKVAATFYIPKRKEKHLSIDVKTKDDYQTILDEMNGIFS